MMDCIGRLFSGKRRPHYEVYQDALGQWRYRVVAANGEKTDASEAYASKSNAIRAVKERIENQPKTWIVLKPITAA